MIDTYIASHHATLRDLTILYVGGASKVAGRFTPQSHAKYLESRGGVEDRYHVTDGLEYVNVNMHSGNQLYIGAAACRATAFANDTNMLPFDSAAYFNYSYVPKLCPAIVRAEPIVGSPDFSRRTTDGLFYGGH